MAHTTPRLAHLAKGLKAKRRVLAFTGAVVLIGITAYLGNWVLQHKSCGKLDSLDRSDAIRESNSQQLIL